MKSTLLSSEVASPYAEAMMSLADTNGLVDRFEEEIRQLADLLASSPELREFIGNPVIDAEDKKAVLKQIASEAHPFLRNFLFLLADKRRIVFIADICEAFLAFVRARKGIELAEVTAAVELTDAQKATVESKVKAMTDASAVEIKTEIDPSLIGGVIIKVGSQVLDASLRGQVRRISLSLGVA